MILLKWLLRFLLVLKLYDVLTKKYVNPYKCYFIFGAKGSGKTITETKLCYKYLCKGWNVYTDMPELMIPGVRFFHTDDLGDFVPERNSCLILGEVGTKFDKRNFKAFRPQLRDFFVFQRKHKVVVFMDSQSYDVDKKIRDRTDGMYLTTNVARLWSVAKRIYIKPEIVEATAEGESRIADNLKIAPVWHWLVTYIPAWVDLYDTDYVVDRKPYLRYDEVPPMTAGRTLQARSKARSLRRAVLKAQRRQYRLRGRDRRRVLRDCRQALRSLRA